jgi:YD repeat-containing protein
MDPNNNPKARASYQAFYYDAANRLTDSVDVGTNGTNGAYTAPGSAPTNRSDILLLTHTTYNSAGWTDTVTDPRGVAARTLYDMLGRTSESIAAYDGTINGGLPSGANNQTTDYTYDGSDHVLTMKAWVTNSGTNQVFQTTQYVYGVTTAGGSKLFSNDLLAKVQYPDKTTGNPGTNTSDIVSFKYNNAGQRIGMTDQNNTVHVYSYDPLGRIGDDTATPGSGVDSTITEMQTYYNDAGQMYLKTSFTNVQTNQVQLTFNGLGQVVTEYQEHNGMVNGGSSQKVQYAYNEMSGGANNSRLTSMTYPNGRVLNYLYGTGLDTSISRVSSQSEGAGTNAVTLAGYSYLGLNTIVKESHPQPGVDLTYIKQGSEPVGDAGDQYTGLDRFGRVVDQRYLNTNSGTNLTATDRFQYGYDRNGNTLYKNNLLNSGSSELYHANSTTSGDNNTAYDPLNRLAGFSRGTLTASANNGGGLDTIATTNRSALAGSLKTWSLDQQGNWTSSSTDGTSTSRTNNDKNQVTSLTTGTNTTNLTFDNNGNTTQDDNGDKYVYDSWNRLVTVKNAANTVIATYKYDPFGRRIQQTEGGVTTDLYYGGTGDWQNLEEQVGGTTKVQNVWSLAYIDDLVLRDRDADNNPATGNWGKTGSGLEERLFAQHDANHNTTAITDQTGSVKQRFVYDPYGKATVLTSGWASSSD